MKASAVGKRKNRMASERGKKKGKRVVKQVILGGIAFLCVFPVLVVFLRSFMTVMESYDAFHLFPRQWTLYSYEKILLMDSEYYVYFWNSVFYTLCILAGGLPISLLAGYGFSHFQFRGKKPLFVFYIVLMLLPFQATLVPQYLTLKSLGMLNTGGAVIFPNLFGAFGTILMTQYMQGIDRELLDAGKMDGLSGFRLFRKLVIPLCRPAIAAWLVLAFIDSWNMIEQPNIFLSEVEKFPLSLRLFGLQADGLMAGGIIFAILPLLLFRYQRDSMVEGIGLGSIK